MNIQLKNISFSYQNIDLFKDFDLNICRGTWLGILGPSGVGKSTLLKLIQQQLEKSNNTASLLPQRNALYPWLNTINNIFIGDRLRGTRTCNIKAKKLLDSVGLKHYHAHYPAQLSGGQAQRAALARLLYEEKEIVIMDEPFSALDAITKHEIQNLAHELLKNKTVILVTHDPQEALRLCDDVIVLSERPVTIAEKVTLRSEKPRALDGIEIQNNIQRLMTSLTQAKHKLNEER